MPSSRILTVERSYSICATSAVLISMIPKLFWMHCVFSNPYYMNYLQNLHNSETKCMMYLDSFARDLVQCPGSDFRGTEHQKAQKCGFKEQPGFITSIKHLVITSIFRSLLLWFSVIIILIIFLVLFFIIITVLLFLGLPDSFINIS